MGPTTATAAEPVLFLQPTSARAQEPETSWASAGAFCAGAAVAAGAVALAAAQPKSTAQTQRREQRAAQHAARIAAPAVTARAAAPSMTATMEAPAKAADVKELYAADPAAAQKEAGTLESVKLQESCKCHRISGQHLAKLGQHMERSYQIWQRLVFKKLFKILANR